MSPRFSTVSIIPGIDTRAPERTETNSGLDCEPNSSPTAARGALEHKVSRDVVNAALAGDPPEGDLKMAFDFGQAIATQSPDAFALGDAIEAKHGRTTRLELAMTAAIVRAYPAMKRGLGLTKSCSITKLEI